jgi:hypothetical protein
VTVFANEAASAAAACSGGMRARTTARHNAASVWRYDRQVNQFGLNWAGPFDRPGAPRQSAALAALTAGIFVAGPGRDTLP